MSRNNFVAPKLPKELRDKFDAGNSSGAQRRKKSLPRKQQRKLERQQKKQHVRRPEAGSGGLRRAQGRASSDGAEEENIMDPWGGDESVDDDELPVPVRKRVKFSPPETKGKKSSTAREPIVVEPQVPPRPSRAVRDALEDDDAEIASLEKKLGIRGKKRAKNGGDDGFDGLLAGIDDAVSGETDEMLAEDRAWLKAKRDYAEDAGESLHDQDSDLDDADIESDQFDPDFDSVDDEMLDAEDDDDNENESAEDFGADSAPSHSAAIRENPYRPPIPTTQPSAQKYIPPSLRAPAKEDKELLQRLRRQLQGLLNRLSESNILSIVKEVEGIIGNNARQHVISTLIDLLVVLIVDRTNHLDTFIALHAAFIAALYGSLGTHFGAQILERLIKEFRHHYDQQLKQPSGTKEASNIIALLAEMYFFQVIGPNLMFDTVRFLLADLSELNTELLLKLIKNCGGQLRADDPMALKDIVLLLQKAVGRKGGESQLPVRTRFMVETISNLKNNRFKSGPAGMESTSEHAMRLKKTIKSNKSRNVEPLGVSLQDIDHAEDGGKWWLVGASWNNSTYAAAQEPEPKLDQDQSQEQDDYFAEDGAEGASSSLLELAKQHRMNTDVRRSIFVTLMSSVDYKDAWLRLKRLRLSKTQQFEIPRVIVYLAGAENRYNPFYRLVAKKLCSEHKYRKALQFNVWAIWRRCGEESRLDDDGSGDDLDQQGLESIELREIASLARFYGELIADQSLSITILKTLDYMYLQDRTQAFVEVLLVTVFQSIDKQCKSRPYDVAARTSDVFTAAKQAPQMTPGLSYFLKSKIKPTSLISDSRQRKMLAAWCRTAISAMALVEFSAKDI